LLISVELTVAVEGADRGTVPVEGVAPVELVGAGLVELVGAGLVEVVVLG